MSSVSRPTPLRRAPLVAFEAVKDAVLRHRPALVVIATCASLYLVLFRNALDTKAVAPNQVFRGEFMGREGHVSVDLRPWREAHAWPDDMIGAHGTIVVMPGRTVGVPLVQGATYTFTNADDAHMPYVIFGHVGLGEHAQLEDPTVLAAPGVSAMKVASWAGDVPWTEDSRRLDDLARACMISDKPSSMTVEGSARGWLVRIGHCETVVPIQEQGGRAPMLVGLGATHGLTISRTGAPIRMLERWNWFFVLVLGLGAVISVVGLGPLGALVAALSATLLGWFHLPAGALVFGAVQVLSLLSLLVQAVMAIRRMAVRMRRTIVALAVSGVFAVIFMVTRNERLSKPHAQGAACVVTGYSTVEGETLSNHSASAGARLGADCDICEHQVDIRAKSGGTFQWVHDTVCGAESPLSVNATLVFLGGGNDDFFWGTHRLEVVSRLIQVLVYTFNPPTFEQWTGLRTRAERGSLAAVDAQAAAIRATAECARNQGGRFFLAHDFLVWDLPKGRSPDRLTMMDRRRSEVEALGGHFVDLYETTRTRASITWFNDYIHLSEVGHRVAAEIICKEAKRP